MIRTRGQRRRAKELSEAKEECESDSTDETEIDALVEKFEEQINIESPRSQKIRRSRRLLQKRREISSDIDSENDSCVANRYPTSESQQKNSNQSSPLKSDSEKKEIDSAPQTPKKRRRTKLKTPPRYASPKQCNDEPSDSVRKTLSKLPKSEESNQESQSNQKSCESDEKQLESNHGSTALNIVFPPFETVTYKNITDYFMIDIPAYAEQWIVSILDLIAASDYAEQTSSYEWLVLIHPSLLLIIAHCKNPTIVTAAQKTLSAFHAFIRHSAEIQAFETLNDLCTSVELLGAKQLPDSLWHRINTRIEEFVSFDKFVYYSVRSKEKKPVLNFPKFKVTSFKSQQSKLKNAWGPCVGMYTTIVRLHRLFVRNPDKLTAEAKEKLKTIFSEFSSLYLPMIPQFLKPLITLSDTFKMDYPFGRYKILCMCTHTNTSIVPTFAGEFGIIDLSLSNADTDNPKKEKIEKSKDVIHKPIRLRRRRRRRKAPPSNGTNECKSQSIEKSESDKSDKLQRFGSELDLQSWESTFRALALNVIQFVSAIDKLFGLSQSDFSFLTIFNSDEIKAMIPKMNFKKRQSISKMKKSDSKHFRALDNIAYVSTCLLTMTYSWPTDKDTNGKYTDLSDQLLQLRRLVVSKMGVLSKESHLFVDNYKQCDLTSHLLMRDYLTYSEQQPQTWELHLIAGIFLCFWKKLV